MGSFALIHQASGMTVILPEPGRGYDATPERVGETIELLDGSLVRQTVAYRRTWELVFDGLTPLEQAAIDRVYRTPGPWRFLDAAQVNLLSPNQSTGGDTNADTTGVSVTTGTLTSATTAPRTGLRHWSWSWTTLGAAAPLLMASAATADVTYAVPVLGGGTYTFSAWVRAASGSPGAFAAKITWYTGALAAISSNEASGVAVTTSYQQRTVTATAPANAVWARPAIIAPSAIGSAGGLYVDDAQFEESAAASPWVPGGGVGLVTVDRAPHSNRILGFVDRSLTLVELAPHR